MTASDTIGITCTTCPIGCRIQVKMEDGKPVSLSGNQCKRGERYAIAEVTEPVRTLTTTVKAKAPDGSVKYLPVRSKEPIPKRLINDAMKQIAMMEVYLPIHRGDTVKGNLVDTQIDLIASRSMQ